MYLDPFVQDGLDPTIYLTNAVRCGPTNKVPQKALNTCPDLYLRSDIDAIISEHTRVCILCTGAKSVEAVSQLKLKSKLNLVKALKGHPFKIANTDGCDVVIFATYHPAYIIRFPNAGRAVIDHLQLIRRWFTNTMPTPSVPKRVPLYAPPPRCNILTYP